jgi:hypothetical protein
LNLSERGRKRTQEKSNCKKLFTHDAESTMTATKTSPTASIRLSVDSTPLRFAQNLPLLKGESRRSRQGVALGGLHD